MPTPSRWTRANPHRWLPLCLAIVIACTPEAEPASAQTPAPETDASEPAPVAVDAARGREAYALLEMRGGVSPYMLALVEEVARDLFGADAHVNEPYVPGERSIHIYVVAPAALQEASPLLGDMTEDTPALALPSSRIILLSERYLKELVTLAVRYGSADTTLAKLLAQLELEGLATARSVWDPSENPVLESNEVAPWWIAVTGALGFVLAHEHGHLALRHPDPSQPRGDDGVVLANREWRDTRWACPDLIDSQWRSSREREAEADRSALDWIKTRTQGASRTRYEFGAGWFVQQLMAQSQLDVARVAMAPVPPEERRAVEQIFGSADFDTIQEQMFGPAVLRALKEKWKDSPRDEVASRFFSRTHPGMLSRLELFYDVYPDRSASVLLGAMSRRIGLECERIAEQQALPEVAAPRDASQIRASEGFRAQFAASTTRYQKLPPNVLADELEEQIESLLVRGGGSVDRNVKDQTRPARKRIFARARERLCSQDRATWSKAQIETAAIESILIGLDRTNPRPELGDADLGRLASLLAAIIEKGAGFCDASYLEESL